MARRIPRDQSLPRVHGRSALFSTAYGNVGSSIYYALGVVAVVALGLTPVAFLIAGFIFVCTAATYTEATVMYPEAGGSASFARHAFNELASFVAGWAQMLNYIITVAISAFFVPHYLAVFWGPLESAPGDVIAGIVLIGLLALLNIRGTQESAKLNLVLAVGDLATQLLLVAIGAVLVLSPDILVSNVELGVAPTWSNFALGIALGMIAYTGIETISNMAEETRDADRAIPAGVRMVVAAVLGLYALLPIVALSAMPVVREGGRYTTELATRYADDPVLGVVENLGLSDGPTDILRIYVGILAAVILVIATNAGLIGLSRLTYSMGQYRQLPERMRQIHPTYRTPHVAIIVFSIIAALTLLPGQAELLATMYSFGAMLSFTIAHVAVLRLRKTQPDTPRPWKPRANVRVGGVEIPLSAVIGGLATAAAWVVVIALNLETLAFGTGWMVAGVALYLLYRRSQELPVTGTVKVLTPEPLDVEEVEYESVVVAAHASSFTPELVKTAVGLAGGRRHGMHVAIFITVPNDLAIDAQLRGPEREARALIARAKLLGGTRVTGSVQRVRAGEAGRRLVALAREIEAEAIVLPVSRRGRGVPLYGAMVRTALAERPCRVLVVADPTASKVPDVEGASGSAAEAVR
ncbi:MAG: APC family permease [Solirubrobacterales bacterium]